MPRHLLQLGHEALNSQVTRNLLHEDLDEDSAVRCGILLSERDLLQAGPVETVSIEQVSEQFGTVPDLVDLMSVDALVLLYETLIERCLIILVDNAQALRQ